MQSDESAAAQDAVTSNGRSREAAGEAAGGVVLGRLRVPRGHDAPRAARAAVTGWMPAAAPRALLQDAQLLISELVTNSVEHAGAAAGTPITVSAGRAEGVVWFKVADAGHGEGPKRRRPRANRGMGLNIVDAVAAHWGVSRAEGTQVWFELPCPPGVTG